MRKFNLADTEKAFRLRTGQELTKVPGISIKTTNVKDVSVITADTAVDRHQIHACIQPQSSFVGVAIQIPGLLVWTGEESGQLEPPWRMSYYSKEGDPPQT